MIDLENKLRAIEREIALRRRVYPRLIARKKMTGQDSCREIAIMEAIAQDYRDLIKAEPQQQPYLP